VIRRDYILRMVEEFFAVLSRLKSLKQAQHWQEAAGTLDSEFQRLVGAGPDAIAALSETELMARLIHGEPTLVVREKTLMLTALLKEAGDVAAGQGQLEKSRACYVKGLNLLLETLATGEVSDYPEFVPRVELFTAELAEAVLPLSTRARLMQHYERNGEFGKAEDALFAMMEFELQNPTLIEFGIAFYERIRNHDDSSLAAGNLPRPELEASLTDLRSRRGPAA
jgi:hypothetical protein